MIATVLHSLAALTLPPRCPGCGAVTAADHRFCADCWRQLQWLGPPWCAGCAAPFAFERERGALCEPCQSMPPAHDGARAAVGYGAVARTLALRLKYGRRTGFAVTAARLMRRLVPEEAELLVPVPLHRGRLWSRGFNQAALIGASLARMADLPHAPDLMRRMRPTPTLRGLGRSGRARAVRGAFVLADGADVRLADRHVVLVDDVYTTGATANACARALKAGGAATVTVLAWARVIEAADD